MSFFGNLSSLFSPQKSQGKPKAAVAPQSPVAGPTPRALPPVQPLTNTKTVRPVLAPQPLKSALKAQPVPRLQDNSSNNATISSAETLAMLREAQAKAREIIVEAKDEALAVRSKAERESREASRLLEEQQRSLDNKLDRLDSRLGQMDQKERDIEKDRQGVLKLRTEVEGSQQQVLERLEKVAGMTRDEAKGLLLEGIEQKMTQEMAQLIRQKEEEAKNEAEEKSREILIDAMKHGATDYVPEYTVSTVTLPSEEAKGKIIGKSGRNIHAFERYTGVDVDLDTSPTEVRLSCFDPVRREIARIALERLIKDGRIQPTRIEEVVDKVRQEIDKVTFEAGKKLCHDVGIYNLPTDLMKLMGRFKFRFSYGQNLIAHTLEETKIGMKLASEMGADVNIVKLGCLLHDIGKVSDEAEGSHVELGVKIAKKYGLPQTVIDCIAQHHEDEPFSGIEQVLVYIADAISGARPGARYENYEEYVERLQKIEAIATEYPGVRQAYAIQAGREVRVILDPEQSKDEDVKVLSLKIRDEIKEKMTYPGTVTVTVLRETRAQQVAT